MALTISEKGKRIVKLIKSVRAAGVLVTGDKVRCRARGRQRISGRQPWRTESRCTSSDCSTGQKSLWKSPCSTRNRGKSLFW